MATTKTAKAAPVPRMSAEERAYQARDDLRTMVAAQAIQGDAVRMKAAQAEMQRQVDALQKVGKKK